MKKLLKRSDKKYRISYSQQGEDLMIDFILNQLGIKDVYFVDIGANDPERFSNTYLMYKNGARGVCIDPNPVFNKMYKKIRPGDLFINAGISGETSGEAMFYNMDWSEFSTFDKEQAYAVQEKYAGRNNIKEEVNLPIISVKDLMEKLTRPVDFLSLDVEGLDFEILSSWDFNNFAPKIICVECKDLKTGQIDTRINDLIMSKGYKLEGSTSINNIYILNS